MASLFNLWYTRRVEKGKGFIMGLTNLTEQIMGVPNLSEQDAKLVLKLVTILNPAFTCVLEFIPSKFHADCLARYHSDNPTFTRIGLLKKVPSELRSNLAKKLASEHFILGEVYRELGNIGCPSGGLLLDKLSEYSKMSPDLYSYVSFVEQCRKSRFVAPLSNT
jgi:hypothetical protein